MNYRKLTFFAALCFFLSVVETAVPKPVPFFRLGLANLPVMLSLAYMNRRESSLLIILKVVLQAIVSGTLFSYIFLFSAAGSFASGFGMMALYSLLCRKHGVLGNRNISWVGISLCGGLMNNSAQLVCAYFIMFGSNVRFIAPVLLAISFVTSILLGIFANTFEEKSEWLKILFEPETAPRVEAPAAGSSEGTEGMSVSEGRKAGKAPIVKMIFALAGIIVVSFTKNLLLVYLVLIIFAGVVFINKGRIRILPSLIVILGVTAMSLLSPIGKILFTIGKFNITLGALESGLLRSGKLCAMVFISQSAVDRNLKLPGSAGVFLQRVLETVSRLTEEKIDFGKDKKISSWISAIDEKLMEAWKNENSA